MFLLCGYYNIDRLKKKSILRPSPSNFVFFLCFCVLCLLFSILQEFKYKLHVVNYTEALLCHAAQLVALFKWEIHLVNYHVCFLARLRDIIGMDTL